MSDFTYEKENIEKKYEKYEWDNVWIDNADNLSAMRALYIGDSISCGVRRIATEQTKEEILFDGFGTSKGIDNGFFKDSIKLFSKQEVKRDFVFFNNGLHGWHLDDEKEYKYYYEEMVRFLLDEFKDTPLVLILTTMVVDKERNNRVNIRNKAVVEIADKYKLPVVDLYKLSTDNSDLIHEDGVHFNTEGYQIFASEIVRACYEILK